MKAKRKCKTCGGSGYEKVHAGVVECEDCDGTGEVDHAN